MLQFFLQNIRGLYRQSKLVFVLLLLSLSVSILSVILIYGFVVSPQRDNENYERETRTFSVGFSQVLLPQELQKIEELYMQFHKELRFALITFEGAEQQICAPLGALPKNLYGVFSGFDFLPQDFAQGVKQALLPEGLNRDGVEERQMKVGDTIELMGQRFEVIGFSSADEIIVPFAALPKETRQSAVRLSLVLQQVPDAAQRQDWETRLQKLFPSAIVIAPAPRNMNTVSRDAMSAATSTLTGLLALLNVSYLYQYILRKRRKAYAILRFSGAQIGQINAVYLAELLLFSLLVFVPCAIGYHFGLSGLMFRYFEFPYAMVLRDYCLLLLLYLLAVLLVFGAVLRKFARQSPNTLYREGNT